MIKFTDMSEFKQGYQFFMLRPSHAGSIFIIIIVCMVLIAIAWSFIGKMDDVVTVPALLRPSTAISHVLALTGGEVLAKKYINDGFVTEGDLLLLFDASTYILDLNNSQNQMTRLLREILVAEYLLATIESNFNAASMENIDAYTRSATFLIEYRRLNGEIVISRTLLERERTMPAGMHAAQRVEDLEKELAQAILAFSVWHNTSLIDATNNLRRLLGEREILERHLSELERNIRNATITAPISGMIKEIRPINIGDNVLPGELILNIIPNDTFALKVELRVDPSNIAMVRIGQKVSLRFPRLPPSRFGKLEAEINLIPADFTIGENARPVFIVEAQITEPYLITRNGEKVFLRAGIGAEGRIIVARDRVIFMILRKLDFISTSMDLIDPA